MLSGKERKWARRGQGGVFLKDKKFGVIISSNTRAALLTAVSTLQDSGGDLFAAPGVALSDLYSEWQQLAWMRNRDG